MVWGEDWLAGLQIRWSGICAATVGDAGEVVGRRFFWHAGETASCDGTCRCCESCGYLFEPVFDCAGRDAGCGLKQQMGGMAQ